MDKEFTFQRNTRKCSRRTIYWTLGHDINESIRSFICWKDKDIEKVARNCAVHKMNLTKIKVHYSEYPSMPWRCIHVNFGGLTYEHMFFLIIDAPSKWLHVYSTIVTTMMKTIGCLSDCFTRFVLQRLTSTIMDLNLINLNEFQRFIASNGIKHKASTQSIKLRHEGLNLK